MKLLIALVLAFTLGLSSVAADELWVKNEGGVEITITGKVDSITYDGIYAYNPENGKLAAANVEAGWIVITGDIEGYEITLACDQRFEDVNPEVRLVKDAPPKEYRDYDSGPSIAEVNEPEPQYDWTGEDYWLYT